MLDITRRENEMKKILIFLILLSSCSLFENNNYYTTAQTQTSLKQYTGYTNSIEPRAVIPIWEDSVELDQDTKQIIDYPFEGQVTIWETETLENGLRKVISTTNFLPGDFADKTVEVYYLDVGNNYTDLEGNHDSIFREQYITYYEDGSEREETITWDSNQGEPNPFDISGREELFQTMTFMSVVEYNQTNLDSGNIRIDGKRLYGNTSLGKEYIWIKETGFAINVMMDGILLRGRVNIEADVWVTIEDRRVTAIEGYYRYNDYVIEL